MRFTEGGREIEKDKRERVVGVSVGLNYSLLVYRMNECIRKEESRREKKHLYSVISLECDNSVSLHLRVSSLFLNPLLVYCRMALYRRTLSSHKAMNFNKISRFSQIDCTYPIYPGLTCVLQYRP